MRQKPRLIEDRNRSTLDDVGPVSGGDQELKVLKEMNELQEFENRLTKPA